MKLTRRFGGFVAIFSGIAVLLAVGGRSPCGADDSTTSKASAESSVTHAAGHAELAQVQLAYRGLLFHRGHRRHLRAMPFYPQPQAESLPNSVDLWPFFEKWGLETRLQGNRETCSVFVVAECIEYALATKQKRGTRLSIEFLNWAANEKTRTNEDGSNFADLLLGCNAFGACPEEDMPYREKFDPASKPSPEAIAHAKENSSHGLKLHWIKEWDDRRGVSEKELAEIKRTLARHWPVCGGLLWPKSKKLNDNVLSVVPRKDVVDGHSVLLVGYRDDPSQPGGGLFYFRNTAGDTRGSSMTYDYAMTYMNDAVWIDYEGAGEGGIPAAEMDGKAAKTAGN